MNIEVATKSDVASLARIHRLFIPSGFLSFLGDKFLYLVYEAIYSSKYGILIVAKIDGQTIGYVSGVIDVKKFYFGFIRHYFFRISFLLFRKVWDPIILTKIIETLSYPIRKKSKGLSNRIPGAELLSIVVDSHHRGSEVSKLLFYGLETEFKKKNIYSFKVIVGTNLERAIRFYEKMGCQRVASIEVHKGTLSYVYVYNISAHEIK